MYLEKYIQQFKNDVWYKTYAPIGWTVNQIEIFEAKLKRKLPIAFKEYLLWGGNVAGPLEQRFDMPFERTLELKENKIALKYLEENRPRQLEFNKTLPEDALVLNTDQGYLFWFIRPDQNDDDPPVYEWTERNDRTSFEIRFDHFSNYFFKMLSGHIKIYNQLNSSLLANPHDEFVIETQKSRWEVYLWRKDEYLKYLKNA